MLGIGYAQNYYFHLRKFNGMDMEYDANDGYRSPQEQRSLDIEDPWDGEVFRYTEGCK
jgi:hypothetical protein